MVGIQTRQESLRGSVTALIIVGVHMFRNVARIDFTRMELGIPAFLTIALMPMTYSISTGLAFGFAAYLVASLASGRAGRVHPVMWVIGVASLVDIVLTAAA